jgi:hypothetical protein
MVDKHRDQTTTIRLRRRPGTAQNVEPKDSEPF